jgi:serine/threonine protein kinase
MEMELGYETLQQLTQRVRLTEQDCAVLMKGVFTALEYLHDEVNVIHRDLKPENIIIMDPNDLSTVKLIDFGLAVKCTKHSIKDFAKCGTLLYSPPE